METAIVLLILFIICIYAVRGSIKHFTGQSACCGGGSAPKKKRKKLSRPVQAAYVIKVEGMHCNHCKTSVENALNGLEGVLAKVNLEKAEANVQVSGEVAAAEMEEAVKKAGFVVKSIEKVL